MSTRLDIDAAFYGGEYALTVGPFRVISILLTALVCAIDLT